MESIQLVGVEQIQHAANTMRSSAEEMKQAASMMQYTLQQHERFLTDWLQQFREVLMAGPGGGEQAPGQAGNPPTG